MESIYVYKTGEFTELVAQFKEHRDAIAFCSSQGWSNNMGVRAPSWNCIWERGRKSWLVVRDSKISE